MARSKLVVPLSEPCGLLHQLEVAVVHDLGRALEHQHAEEVRQARTALGVVAGLGVVPDVHGGDRGVVVLGEQHAQAVGEAVLDDVDARYGGGGPLGGAPEQVPGGLLACGVGRPLLRGGAQQPPFRRAQLLGLRSGPVEAGLLAQFLQLADTFQDFRLQRSLPGLGLGQLPAHCGEFLGGVDDLLGWSGVVREHEVPGRVDAALLRDRPAVAGEVVVQLGEQRVQLQPGRIGRERPRRPGRRGTW